MSETLNQVMHKIDVLRANGIKVDTSIQDISQQLLRAEAEANEAAVRAELERRGWLSPEAADVLRRQAAYYNSLGGVPKPNTIDEVDPH